MLINNINVEDTIDRIKTLIAEEENLLPALINVTKSSLILWLEDVLSPMGAHNVSG